MQFTVSASKLKDALNKFAKVKDDRNIPILQAIFIEFKNREVKFLKNNLDMQLEVNVPLGYTEKEGIASVSFKQLQQFVKGLPVDSTVNFTLQDDSKLLLKTDNAQMLFDVINKDDYPTQLGAGDEFNYCLTLDNNTLSKIITNTINHASDEESRYYLMGGALQYDTESNTLNHYAVNGIRMVKTKLTVPVTNAPSLNIIISTDTMKALQQVIKKDKDGVTTLFLTNNVCINKVAFVSKGTRLVAKLIDGTYPDVNKIKINTTSSVRINKKNLINAINLMTDKTKKCEQSILLVFDQDDTIVTKDDTESSAKVNHTLTGSKHHSKTRLNLYNFLNCLNTFESEDVLINFKHTDVTGSDVLTINGYNESGDIDANTIVLLMPMRY